MLKEKIERVRKKVNYKKVYKGPIIEIRGVIRLIFACLPFVIGYYFSDKKDLWSVGFLCSAFTSACFVGIENNRGKFGYSIWTAGFIILSLATAWKFSNSLFLTGVFLIIWSVVASMSFAAGPIASLPVNIGLTLFVLFLLNQELSMISFWAAILVAGSGIAWSYILGFISILSPVKNQITLPNIKELRAEFRDSLTWESPYIRNGLARGIILVLIGIALSITNDKSLIITAFTVLIAMLPGRNQTRFKILSRVAAAMGAIIAANILLNVKPPFWFYILGLIIGIAILRWIILRTYTYNSFFLITFPLFLVSLGGYYDNTWSKLWYTVLGAIISIIASELFVFRQPKYLD